MEKYTATDIVKDFYNKFPEIDYIDERQLDDTDDYIVLIFDTSQYDDKETLIKYLKRYNSKFGFKGNRLYIKALEDESYKIDSMDESIYDDVDFDPEDYAGGYTEWDLIDSKQVKDSDGFWTDYTMWYNGFEDKYVFIFGDSDIYYPENSDYDWECESEEEAREWFDSYNGFEDDGEFDESLQESFNKVLTESYLDQMSGSFQTYPTKKYVLVFNATGATGGYWDYEKVKSFEELKSIMQNYNIEEPKIPSDDIIRTVLIAKKRSAASTGRKSIGIHLDRIPREDYAQMAVIARQIGFNALRRSLVNLFRYEEQQKYDIAEIFLDEVPQFESDLKAKIDAVEKDLDAAEQKKAERSAKRQANKAAKLGATPQAQQAPVKRGTQQGTIYAIDQEYMDKILDAGISIHASNIETKSLPMINQNRYKQTVIFNEGESNEFTLEITANRFGGNTVYTVTDSNQKTLKNLPPRQLVSYIKYKNNEVTNSSSQSTNQSTNSDSDDLQDESLKESRRSSKEQYYVAGFFDDDFRGVDDNLYTDDFDLIKDKAWELVNNGDALIVKNVTTGDEVRIKSDEVFQGSDYDYGYLEDKINPLCSVYKKGIGEAYYGGAFDIEDNQFFTRDDLNELMDVIDDKLSGDMSVTGIYMSDDGKTVEVDIASDELGETTVYQPVDFRKIKIPSDLSKYADAIIRKAKSDLQYDKVIDDGNHIDL